MASFPVLNTPRSKTTAYTPPLTTTSSYTSHLRKVAERYRVVDSIIWEDAMKIIARYAQELGHVPAGKALEVLAQDNSLSTPANPFEHSLVYYTRTKNLIPIDDFLRVVVMYTGPDLTYERDDSDWLSKSTDDGRSEVQPSFDAEIGHAMYEAKWVKEKARLMEIIQKKEDDFQELDRGFKEMKEKGASLEAELETLIKTLRAAKKKSEAADLRVHLLETERKELEAELREMTLEVDKSKILLEEHRDNDQELTKKADSQTETIANLQHEVTNLREQLGERPSLHSNSGNNTPLSLEIELASSEGEPEVETEDSSFVPLRTVKDLKRHWPRISTPTLERHLQWYIDNKLLPSMPPKPSKGVKLFLYKALKDVVEAYEEESGGDTASSMATSSQTLVESHPPSLASIPTSAMPQSGYQSLQSVDPTEDATLGSVSSYASVATHPSGAGKADSVDKCVDATPSVIFIAVQTDDIETSRRIFTSIAIQADLTPAPHTTIAATQTDSSMISVHTATQTDPVQTDSSMIFVHTATQSDPVQADSSLIFVHTATQPDPAQADSSLISVHTATQTDPVQTSDQLDARYRVSAITFLIRLPLGRPTVIRLPFSLPRVSLRAFGLHIIGASSWLILWTILVMALLVMSVLAGWPVLASSRVYEERNGWVGLHQVRPRIEGFSENRWSVRHIIMDRWRRFWYGYWERREIERLAN